MTRFIPPSPMSGGSGSETSSAKAQFMKALKQSGGNIRQANAAGDSSDRYQSILKEKMNEVRDEALRGGSYGFHLDGTDGSECREMSAGAKDVLQKIAERKAKKEAKKAKKENIISITPRYFCGVQGGRVDKNGKIYDSKGHHILSVDKTSGKIKNEKTGCSVGKYKPNCGYSEHRMAELVSKYDSSKNSGSLWGTAPTSSGGGTDIWGNSSDKSWW